MLSSEVSALVLGHLVITHCCQLRYLVVQEVNEFGDEE